MSHCISNSHIYPQCARRVGLLQRPRLFDTNATRTVVTLTIDCYK